MLTDAGRDVCPIFSNFNNGAICFEHAVPVFEIRAARYRVAVEAPGHLLDSSARGRRAVDDLAVCDGHYVEAAVQATIGKARVQVENLERGIPCWRRRHHKVAVCFQSTRVAVDRQRLDGNDVTVTIASQVQIERWQISGHDPCATIESKLGKLAGEAQRAVLRSQHAAVLCGYRHFVPAVFDVECDVAIRKRDPALRAYVERCR